MDHTIDVPEHRPDAGLRFAWDDGFEIEVSAGPAEVVIRANRAGLTSLARHLLTLAQEGVHPGSHLHLTAQQEIESDHDLVLELMKED
ncbi:hypothetical protein [Streptomyces nitrosporeus]|uniref:Uncharacterized protein n=1 Tax=Streptomyces nitrosporeus TaxID=28894 RepID=A0A5J6FAP4_9ACTN|nr:hypothetical protein [Streptomyces nitrosporeus]QEU72584.1 hypothetical protein CP967_11770 [Streptomyces nitrosporeus]GGY76764.1 hypothetical protein GCM10010327_03490 [Streptomyces nitrosporeus]